MIEPKKKRPKIFNQQQKAKVSIRNQDYVIQPQKIVKRQQQKYQRNDDEDRKQRNFEDRKDIKKIKFCHIFGQTIKLHLISILKKDPNLQRSIKNPKQTTQQFINLLISGQLINSEGKKSGSYWIKKMQQHDEQGGKKTLSEWFEQFIGSIDLQRSFSDYVSQRLFDQGSQQGNFQQTTVRHQCQCRVGRCRTDCGCVMRNIRCNGCQCDQTCENLEQPIIPVDQFLNLGINNPEMQSSGTSSSNCSGSSSSIINSAQFKVPSFN